MPDTDLLYSIRLMNRHVSIYIISELLFDNQEKKSLGVGTATSIPGTGSERSSLDRFQLVGFQVIPGDFLRAGSCFVRLVLSGSGTYWVWCFPGG
jgi:hypothetical protein